MKRNTFYPHPPLAEIEQRLFGVSEGLIEAVKSGKTSARIAQSVMASPEWMEYAHASQENGLPPIQEQEVIHPPPMPAHLQELIRRRVAASEATFARVPTSGQIVEVRQIVTPKPKQLDWVMQVPLYVLLDAEAESKTLWHGWLATYETDYATSWDFVLQEEDEPFDPEAGMVQVWNPVRLYLPMAGRPVAQLRLERLQAVRALSAEFLLHADEPEDGCRPGRIAVREIDGVFRAATGSPVGGRDDPRRQYQRLYFRAAEAVREPARLALAALVSVPNPILNLLRKLVEAGRELGEDLRLVPRLEQAMGKTERHPMPPFGHHAVLGVMSFVGITSGLVGALQHVNDPAPNDVPNSQQAGESDVFSEADDEMQPDTLDVQWGDIARIRVLDAQVDGSGQVMIIANSGSVIASLFSAGQLLDKATAHLGGAPAILSWEGETSPELLLQTLDNRKLDLRLGSPDSPC